MLATIKQLFSSSQNLLAPNINKTFILSTDCSALAIGFSLKQEKNWKIVIYCSKWLSEAESRLGKIERELLAMPTRILKYSRFPMGSHLIVEEDNKPIKYLQTQIISKPRILRYLIQLQEFPFSILTVAGSQNMLADILSRTL